MTLHVQALKLHEISHDEPHLLAKPEHITVVNTKPDVVEAQIRHNLQRGLPEFTRRPRAFPLGSRTVSLCGSGPSLMSTIGELKGKVFAFNAAIPALHKAGVKVDYAMIWDATPEMERYAIPIPGCTWMIASRVNPKVLDRLVGMGQTISLWHAACEGEAAELLGQERTQVPGGRQSVTRGIILTWFMGFRTFHVFGADSSFSEMAMTHVGGPLRDEQEIVCVVEGKGFRCTNWMMLQAQDWVEYILPDVLYAGGKVVMHGHGLLPWAHEVYMRAYKPALRTRLRRLGIAC